MAYIIELREEGLPRYYSIENRGANPTHSWGEKKDALQFAREKDARDFAIVHIRDDHPYCKYIEYKTEKAAA